MTIDYDDYDDHENGDYLDDDEDDSGRKDLLCNISFIIITTR